VCNLLIEKHLRLVDAQLGPVVDGVGVGLHPALSLYFPYKYRRIFITGCRPTPSTRSDDGR
jgi:hypothetical protein